MALEGLRRPKGVQVNGRAKEVVRTCTYIAKNKVTPGGEPRGFRIQSKKN